MKTLLVAALLSMTLSLPQDHPAPEPPSKEHVWLKQLVGEWNCKVESVAEPGVEAMSFESTESVRAIGDYFILAEGNADFMGEAFTSLTTLGYDPEEDVFVGTWVDSLRPNLWTYRGTLDESGKVLTLETEGPGWNDPSVTMKYRDVLTIYGKDHKELSSWALGEDGEWSKFMVADFRRAATLEGDSHEE